MGMKAIICNKIREEDPDYFLKGWRIPHIQLENIGWVTVDQKEIGKKLGDFFTKKYNELPAVILFWNTNTFISDHWDEILKNKWMKCIYMDDLHQTSSKVINFRNLVLKHFDYIFSTYAYVLSTFYPLALPEKIVWYPHCVNDKFNVGFNTNPKNRILLTGDLTKTVYPFRFHVSNLAKRYPIDILQQMSFKHPSHPYFGRKYIEYINGYIASVTCCSNERTPYIIAKFFEIPASGALLLAYEALVKEPLKELGFVDGEHYISVNYNNIVEKIQYVTNPKNRTEVDRIRSNGYNFIWANHTILNRIKVIEDRTRV